MMQMWDKGALREMTPEEIAEWRAAQAVPPPVPRRITRRQGRLALLQAGLLDAVETAITQAPRAVQITWQDATEWWREDPMIATFATELGLSAEAVDSLFRAAAEL